MIDISELISSSLGGAPYGRAVRGTQGVALSPPTTPMSSLAEWFLASHARDLFAAARADREAEHSRGGARRPRVSGGNARRRSGDPGCRRRAGCTLSVEAHRRRRGDVAQPGGRPMESGGAPIGRFWFRARVRWPSKAGRHACDLPAGLMSSSAGQLASNCSPPDASVLTKVV